MKPIDLTGYQSIHAIRGWKLYEHPKEFRFVLCRVRKGPVKTVAEQVATWVAPGLTSDPDVTVPAAWVRALVGQRGSRVAGVDQDGPATPAGHPWTLNLRPPQPAAPATPPQATPRTTGIPDDVIAEILRQQ